MSRSKNKEHNFRKNKFVFHAAGSKSRSKMSQYHAELFQRQGWLVVHFGSFQSFPNFLPSQSAIRTSSGYAPHKHQIAKEVIRWGPAMALGISHSNMRDDAYEGCRVSKDSILYGNIWNMYHDEGHYVRAEESTPERYEGWD